MAAFALQSAPAHAGSTHVLSSSFGSAGAQAGELSSPGGVAVDAATHDLYVADRGNARVDQFSPSGTFIRAWGWGVADGLPAFETCTAICQQGTFGSGIGQFTNAAFVAVDNSAGPSTGDVYVADKGDELISKFTAEGALVESWGTGGQLAGTSSGAGSFGEIAGIAVDTQGTLLVINSSSTLFKYAQDGTFVEDFTVERGTAADGLAVNTEGDFFKVNGEPTVEEQNGAGASGDIGQVTRGANATGIAIDSATGDLYDAEGGIVRHYASTGPGRFKGSGGSECVVAPFLGCPTTDSFGNATFSTSAGIAVDPTDAEVYVADASEGKIYAFAAAVVPGATTGEASQVATTSATLNGSVEPAGTEITSCSFEYGEGEGALTHSAPCEPTPTYTGNGTIEVSAHLIGLQTGSPYRYRMVVDGTQGEVVGEEVAFHTYGPPLVEGEELGNATRTTAQILGVVSPNQPETEFWIEYGATPAYGQASLHKKTGAGFERSREYTQLEGLQPGAIYHYRVVARNEYGVSYGSDQTFATFGVASIGAELPFEVGVTTATLHTSVETLGLESTYRYEYGTTTAYGSVTVNEPLGGQAKAELTGLAAGTKYHFRLVVENSEGTARGPDATFTTRPQASEPALLPDGRGYEKVSPNANSDGDVYQDAPPVFVPVGAVTYLPFAVSPTGESVAYVGEPPEKGGIGRKGADVGNEYLAKRSADGWRSNAIVPSPVSKHDFPYYDGFSEDFSAGFLVAGGIPYMRDLASGVNEPLVAEPAPDRPMQEFVATYAGSAAGGSHVLFAANDALTPNAVAGSFADESLYDRSGGTLTLVNVLPDGSATVNATFGGPAAHDSGGNTPAFDHAVSSSGNRIFWTDLETGDLYVRENDTAPPSPVVGGECTVAVDACTKLVAAGAQFWAANPQGTKAIYTKAGDLYEYDSQAGASTDIAKGANVLGVVGTSEDLSYLYVVAEGPLAPGSTAHRCEAGSNQEERGELAMTVGCNLFVLHAGDEPRLIANLSVKDNQTVIQERFETKDGDWVPGLGNKEAEVTPDGAHLLFESTRSLTGFANSDSEQIYLYDYADSALRCVSCAGTGQSAGKWNSYEGIQISAFLTISIQPTRLPQWMSDDGNRAFFGTTEALVPQDTNGMPDVYEWEREGTGSCRDLNGCIYLISDGSSREGSYLIATTRTGDDVFFTTRGALVPEDENEDIDVYDARVGAVAPAVPARCTGTGCQGVPAAPPTFATPSSQTYDGVGNLRQSTGAGRSTKPRSKSLSRAQKLVRALKRCESVRRSRRATCRAQARKLFGHSEKTDPRRSHKAPKGGKR